MSHPAILAITLLLIVNTSGRIYYLRNVDDAKYLSKESSRDLDLSFSAGDTDTAEDPANLLLQPIKKTYTRVTPLEPIANSERSEPMTYYTLSGTPVKAESEDIIVLPEKQRKLVKIDGNKKGEIILELRLIATHDAI